MVAVDRERSAGLSFKGADRSAVPPSSRVSHEPRGGYQFPSAAAIFFCHSCISPGL